MAPFPESATAGPVAPVAGIRLGTAAAGLRYPDRRDLVVVELASGTRTAAVWTRNAFRAAPIVLAEGHLAECTPRFLLINTGYANAGTGEPGLADTRACCAALAAEAGCPEAAVLPFSTGVIGERLPVAKLTAGLPAVLTALRADGWEEAALGIMTTDTRPKTASRTLEVGGRPVTITGMAKGAGMICPNMATLLAFVGTDAALPQALLDQWVREAADASFNRITVDGDTSTNDACVLMATGQSGAVIDSLETPDAAAFIAALHGVFLDLAHAIIADAEGATRFVTVQVSGGRSEDECDRVARTIAHSPLVKTALYAGDPNWGRILAAVGRAGVADLAIDGVSVYLDDVCLAQGGALHPAYQEAAAAAVMARAAYTVRVDLGRGMAEAVIWTCDLSHDYVRINADYRS